MYPIAERGLVKSPRYAAPMEFYHGYGIFVNEVTVDFSCLLNIYLNINIRSSSSVLAMR
jgi:hypothetical protein